MRPPRRGGLRLSAQHRHNMEHIAQFQFGLHHAFGAAILLAAVTEFSQPVLQPACLVGRRHAAHVSITDDRQIIGNFQGLCQRQRGGDQHCKKGEARAHDPKHAPSMLKAAFMTATSKN